MLIVAEGDGDVVDNDEGGESQGRRTGFWFWFWFWLGRSKICGPRLRRRSGGILISSLCGCDASSARCRVKPVSGSSGVNPARRGMEAGSSFVGGCCCCRGLSIDLVKVVEPGMLRFQESGLEVWIVLLDPVVDGAGFGRLGDELKPKPGLSE